MNKQINPSARGAYMLRKFVCVSFRSSQGEGAVVMTNCYKKCFILIAVFMLLFSQLAIAQSTEMEKQLEKLTQKLNLSEEQTTKAREILQEVQSQKETDRQTYKTDALALIQAAWTRRNFLDNKIEPKNK